MLSKKLIITIIGTSIFLCISLGAAPIWKQIKVYLNPSIQYTLDGNTILSGAQTLNYNNKNYVSVSELANALGLEVTYKDNVVSFITPTTNDITIDKCIIKEISKDSKQLTILPDGALDEVMNYIVLNTNADTLIKHPINKRLYTIGDLEVGMVISVTHSAAMTRSIPPQATAFSITILEDSATQVVPESITLDKMVVVETNHKESYFIVAPQGLDGTNPNMQTIIRYDQKTKIKFDNNTKEQSSIDALKIGMNVTLSVSPAMTLSIPPQTFVLEITVH